MMDIAEGIKQKKKRALSRAITWTEDQDPRSFEVIESVYELTGRAHYVGITGNPGAGKSTLVNGLIRTFKERGKSVAVLAVDPSSPFSGGAILGDRIRIDDDLLREGVYFRSISNRNHLGGISATTYESLLLLDAFGFDVIIVETVGTGQSETEVIHLVDTTVVVTVPGLGDDIQAEKAGILEIGDIFVINKSDLPGATKLKGELQTMLNLRKVVSPHPWEPPLVMTKAIAMEGIGELADQLQRHHEYCLQQGTTRQNRYEWAIKQKMKAFILEHIDKELVRFLDQVKQNTDMLTARTHSHIYVARKFAKSFLASVAEAIEGRWEGGE